MRRNFIILLCIAFALSLLADEPQPYSIEYLTGAKIASADAYNFEWDDETGIATINESDYAMMGKCCVLTSSSASGGDVFLSSVYGDFKIPLKINPTTGAVRIETGKALAKINIGLDVTGIREDGYHEVKMIMQTLKNHSNAKFQMKELKSLLLLITEQKNENLLSVNC